MQTVTIEVGDIHFERNCECVLTAPSLGASVCVGLYDPVACIGGVYVFIFPNAAGAKAVDPDQFPLFFADIGLNRFFSMAHEQGIDVHRSKIAVCGGAFFLDAFGGGNLGKRNSEAVCRYFAKTRIKPDIVEVGGIANCSLELDLREGVLRVEAYGGEKKRI